MVKISAGVPTGDKGVFEGKRTCFADTFGHLDWDSFNKRVPVLRKEIGIHGNENAGVGEEDETTEGRGKTRGGAKFEGKSEARRAETRVERMRLEGGIARSGYVLQRILKYFNCSGFRGTLGGFIRNHSIESMNRD